MTQNLNMHFFNHGDFFGCLIITNYKSTMHKHLMLIHIMSFLQAQCLINVCGDAVQISYDCEPVQVDFPSSLNTPNIVTQSYAEASS